MRKNDQLKTVASDNTDNIQVLLRAAKKTEDIPANTNFKATLRTRIMEKTEQKSQSIKTTKFSWVNLTALFQKPVFAMGTVALLLLITFFSLQSRLTQETTLTEQKTPQFSQEETTVPVTSENEVTPEPVPTVTPPPPSSNDTTRTQIPPFLENYTLTFLDTFTAIEKENIEKNYIKLLFEQFKTNGTNFTFQVTKVPNEVSKISVQMTYRTPGNESETLDFIY